MQKIADILLCLVALVLLAYAGTELYWRYRPLPSVPSPSPVTVTEGASPAPLPTRLVIPTLALDLPVVPAEVKNGVWPTTRTGVSYLRSSPLPGDVGNTVIYGHNWASLLGNLKKVKPGEQLVVYRGAVSYTYTIRFVGIVNPSDTYITESTPDQRLTLYTCIGFLDRQRLVVTATLDQT